MILENRIEAAPSFGFKVDGFLVGMISPTRHCKFRGNTL